jgi:hypothetical protein
VKSKAKRKMKIERSGLKVIFLIINGLRARANSSGSQCTT